MELEAPARPKMVVCLVAGREAADRFPSLLRYLQLGLIDESIATLRVVTQGEPLATLQTGVSIVLQDRPLTWPLSRWSRRLFIDGVHRKLEAMHHGRPIVVHGLADSSAEWAEEIADVVGGDLVLTVSSFAQTRDVVALRRLTKAVSIMTLSPRLRDALPETVRAGKPVEVIPVGLSAAAPPAAFKGGQRAPVAVYIGSLSAESGVDCLLRAVKQVHSREPGLLLFVIGKGHAEDDLRRLAESLEINENVTFTGKIDDWRSVLEAADMFCVPGQSAVWREEPLAALAAGVCVLSAEGNLCDELIDGRTAFVFHPNDDAALAQHMCKLLADRTTARNMAAAGQELIRSQNTPAKMVAEHLRIYQQITSRRQLLAFPGVA